MHENPFSQQFRAEPAQVRAVRHAIVDYGRDHGAADLDAVAIAVTEAMTNAVIHAYVGMAACGTVRVTAESRDGDGFEVVVADDGNGSCRRDDSPGMGLGVPLMAASSQCLELRRPAGGGTRVRMVFAGR